MELTLKHTAVGCLAGRPDLADSSGTPSDASADPVFRDLRARLLGLAGDGVAVQAVDAWSFEMILRGGDLVSPAGLVRRRGRPNRCHENAAALWLANPSRYRIQIGFGLNGGVWRRHTWLLDKAGRVVETTRPREVYFGVTLDDAQAKNFAAAMLTYDEPSPAKPKGPVSPSPARRSKCLCPTAKACRRKWSCQKPSPSAGRVQDLPKA